MRFLARFFMESTAFRRCLAFVFHLVGIAGCYLLAHLIRFDFEVPEKHWDSFYRTFWVVVASYLSCILLFGLYRGLWRFFTLRDCVLTGIAFAVGTLFATVLCAIAVAGVIVWVCFSGPIARARSCQYSRLR